MFWFSLLKEVSFNFESCSYIFLAPIFFFMTMTNQQIITLMSVTFVVFSLFRSAAFKLTSSLFSLTYFLSNSGFICLDSIFILLIWFQALHTTLYVWDSTVSSKQFSDCQSFRDQSVSLFSLFVTWYCCKNLSGFYLNRSFFCIKGCMVFLGVTTSSPTKATNLFFIIMLYYNLSFLYCRLSRIFRIFKTTF